MDIKKDSSEASFFRKKIKLLKIPFPKTIHSTTSSHHQSKKIGDSHKTGWLSA